MLLGEIRRLARELGKTPSSKDMAEHGKYWKRSYQLRFGSWNKAVKQAGLSTNQTIPQDQFIEPPDKCPLCGGRARDLDFHHWRYGSDPVGCYLCRGCHKEIHSRGGRPSDNVSWLLDTVAALTEIHIENHGRIREETVAERYNVPSAELVNAAASDVIAAAGRPATDSQ